MTLKSNIEQEHFLLLVFCTFFHNRDYFRIYEGVITELDENFPWWAEVFFRWVIDFIYNNSFSIRVIKSKRRKTYKCPETWKKLSIKTRNYKWANIYNLLWELSQEAKSICVHDFYIDDYTKFLEVLSDFITQSLDDFVEGKTKCYGISFNKAKKLLYRRLFSAVEMSAWESEFFNEKIFLDLSYSMFGQDIIFPYFYMTLIFERLGYIERESSFEHGWRDYWYEKYRTSISITQELQDIVHNHLLIEEHLLDVIFDSKYKKLIVWWNKKWFLLEKVHEVSSEDTNFIRLQKSYPHSEISTQNYDGKNEKYVVKQKIRFTDMGR